MPTKRGNTYNQGMDEVAAAYLRAQEKAKQPDATPTDALRLSMNKTLYLKAGGVLVSDGPPARTRIDGSGLVYLNDVAFREVIHSKSRNQWHSPTGVVYKNDYRAIAEQIIMGDLDEKATYRELVETDLWFLTYFMLRNPVCNDIHGHWVRMCRMVDEGPTDNVLDLWAREHAKTTLLTTNCTIRDVLKNPESTTVIFSYTQEAARVFYREIKFQLEQNEDLQWLYPDVLWEKPPKNIRWNDDSLVVKRRVSQREGTVEPWGLLTGMPTGRHFFMRRYDDISTLDLANSPDQMNRMKDMFDMSTNVGRDDGQKMIAGTPYHHDDVLAHIKAKTDTNKKLIYLTRTVPATIDGTFLGESIYLTDSRIDELRQNRRFFNSQQLLNPTPGDEIKLPYSMLTHVKQADIPDDLIKVMVIDPAGNRNTSRKDNKRADAWAIWVMGMERVLRPSGVFAVYVLDGIISQLRYEDAISEVVKIYLRNGFIRCIGVESTGLATTEIHIKNALHAKGRFVSMENGTIKKLSPSRREKRTRIEGYLATPLHQGALYISDKVATETLSILREEMERYPAWHEDGIDGLAYGYEMFAEHRVNLATGKEPIKKDKGPRPDPWADEEDTKSLNWMVG